MNAEPTGLILDRLRSAYEEDESTATKYDRQPIVSMKVFRPVSFLLTVPFVRMGLSANQVTVMRYPMIITSLVMFSTGDRMMSVVAALLHAMDYMLDYVDGNLARLYRNPTRIGAYLDEIADRFKNICCSAAIGIGLYRNPDQLMALLPGTSSPRSILLMGLASTLAMPIVYRWRLKSLASFLGCIIDPTGEGRTAHLWTPRSPAGSGASRPPAIRAGAGSRSVVANGSAALQIMIVPLAALDILSFFILFRFTTQLPYLIYRFERLFPWRRGLAG